MNLINGSRLINVKYGFVFYILTLKLCFGYDRLKDLKLEKGLAGSVFLTHYGGSLMDCQDRCEQRAKCKSINYRRLSRHCQLNSVIAVDDTELADQPGWLYQGLTEWNTGEMCGTQQCLDTQVCDTEIPECKIKECNVFPTSSAFRVFGNTNSVGARTVLACPVDQYPSPPESLSGWPVRTVCQEDGTWSVTGLSCNDYKSNCHEYLASTREWSRFELRDVELVSGECGVPDASLTASSIHDPTFPASEAKFSVLDTSWVAAVTPIPHYIQVEFGTSMVVKRVQTKGRPNPGGNHQQYVLTYTVTYSTISGCPTASFSHYALSQTGHTVFNGNTDGTSEVENEFQTPIHAVCVRINPNSVMNTANAGSPYPAMKFELIGSVKLPVF